MNCIPEFQPKVILVCLQALKNKFKHPELWLVLVRLKVVDKNYGQCKCRRPGEARLELAPDKGQRGRCTRGIAGQHGDALLPRNTYTMPVLLPVYHHQLLLHTVWSVLQFALASSFSSEPLLLPQSLSEPFKPSRTSSSFLKQSSPSGTGQLVTKDDLICSTDQKQNMVPSKTIVSSWSMSEASPSATPRTAQSQSHGGEIAEYDRGKLAESISSRVASGLFACPYPRPVI
ncbi:hypothetical protein KQX54_001936 [Cotesia glomerata]|uniref:Uncharacterized protein n=1 Tax=Cotesia glomerata TaxID=32391 RepID=A0AAV7HY71_COTGL|nr:hypothetical protein KQX54_001936 [Cotesia glomerata]